MGVPAVIGGANLPSPVAIGLTDLPNIGGPRFRHQAFGVPPPYANVIKVWLLIFTETLMPEPGGGARGATAPPIFGRSVNPIPTGEGRLSPPVTAGTPNVFHLPA